MGNRSSSSVEVTTPGERDVVVKRWFDAPVALVWQCYTEPTLVRRWLLGPPGWSLTVCEIDLRVGGAFRYRWQNDTDGGAFGIGGIFRQVDPERLIRHSEQPEDAPEMPESLCKIEFIPHGGRTELIMTMTYGDGDLRNQVLATGMADGMGMSFDLLDAILQEQRR